MLPFVSLLSPAHSSSSHSSSSISQFNAMTATISFPFPFLILFFFLSNNAFLQQPLAAPSTSPHQFARFDLIHRHSPLLTQRHDKSLHPPETPLERFKELVHSDISRQQRVSHRLSQRRKTAQEPTDNSTSINYPLRSAAEIGVGQFFVTIDVGTPPKRFALIADTGSDLTWINCKSSKCSTCKKGFKFPPLKFFLPDKSSTFESIPCSSPKCKKDFSILFSLNVCPTPLSPCNYQYNYIDDSVAYGYFANEVVAFGTDAQNNVKTQKMLVGCTESSVGIKGLDGVLGLGYSNYSFAMTAARTYNNKFSYCLVDHLSPSTKVGYLHFGENSQKSTKMQYTELLLRTQDQFYAVNVSGISVGGQQLDINPAIFDATGDGGVLLDTGSTLTSMALPAYKPLMEVLTAPLKKFKRVNLNVPTLEFCFSSVGFDESIVPPLVWHFADGAEFVPPKKSYIIDAAKGVKCVGLYSTRYPGASIIGSIMQQNHLWEFDLENRKLGFGLSLCV